MVTMLAHIHVLEGRAQAFEKIISVLYEETHRLEPHCRRYEYWRGETPNLYYCFLSFDDFQAFLTHQTSDHHEAPDIKGLLKSIKLEWVDPIPSASDLASTRSQAVPDNADALTLDYAEKYAVKIQGWWSAPH